MSHTITITFDMVDESVTREQLVKFVEACMSQGCEGVSDCEMDRASGLWQAYQAIDTYDVT